MYGILRSIFYIHTIVMDLHHSNPYDHNYYETKGEMTKQQLTEHVELLATMKEKTARRWRPNMKETHERQADIEGLTKREKIQDEIE